MTNLRIQAPGRVCLFGDHQDYLGLPIIACAINRYLQIDAYANDDQVFNVNLPDIDEKRTFSLSALKDDKLKKGDHLAFALRLLLKKNFRFSSGYHVTIKGNLVINAGLSSSSALTVAWIQFLVSVSNGPMILEASEIAKLAYEAEVKEQGGSGGMMDQYAISLGKVIYLETWSNFEVRYLDKWIPGLIVAESGIPKDTDGLLAEIKEKTFKAIDQAKQVYSDFDLNTADQSILELVINQIDVEVRPYLEAAIGNHLITQVALQELERTTTNLSALGQLMNDHHSLLKDKLGITVPRIDAMIEAAHASGANGSKIVGSGGGGCIIVLSPPGMETKIIKALLAAGAKAAYEVTVVSGVSTTQVDS